MSRELVALASHNNVGPRLEKFNTKKEGASPEPPPEPAPEPATKPASGEKQVSSSWPFRLEYMFSSGCYYAVSRTPHAAQAANRHEL